MASSYLTSIQTRKNKKQKAKTKVNTLEPTKSAQATSTTLTRQPSRHDQRSIQQLRFCVCFFCDHFVVVVFALMWAQLVVVCSFLLSHLVFFAATALLLLLEPLSLSWVRAVFILFYFYYLLIAYMIWVYVRIVVGVVNSHSYWHIICALNKF